MEIDRELEYKYIRDFIESVEFTFFCENCYEMDILIYNGDSHRGKKDEIVLLFYKDHLSVIAGKAHRVKIKHTDALINNDDDFNNYINKHKRLYNIDKLLED